MPRYAYRGGRGVRATTVLRLARPTVGVVPAPLPFYCLSRGELRRTNRCPIPSLVIFPTICYGLRPDLPILPLRRKPRPPSPDGAVGVSVRLTSHRLRDYAFTPAPASCGQDAASGMRRRFGTDPILFSSYLFARCLRPPRRIPHLRSQGASRDGKPCFPRSERAVLVSGDRTISQESARRSPVSVRAAGWANPCRSFPFL